MKLSKTIKVLQTLDSQILFNLKNDITEEALNNIFSIDDFPCINLIYQINQLITNKANKPEEIEKYKQIFYNNRHLFPELNINVNTLFNKENTILSVSSCINIIERILKYGKFKNNQICELNDEYISIIILLNVFETTIDEKNDLNADEKDIIELYLSIISYNQFSNDIDNSNFFRLRYIYEHYLKQNKNLLNQFKKFYGYSLDNYLIFLQLFLLLGKHNNTFIDKNIFNDTDNAKEIINCINDSIFNYKSENDKDKIIINSYIPSQYILKKPIIEINNKYFVINPDILLKRIYSFFFEKIKASYTSEKDYHRNFYGPLFENYCRDVAKNVCIRSNFKYYEFINEFKYYINKEENFSSDFYIIFNDTIIIFEIKSTARYKETTINVDLKKKSKFISDEIQYKVIKPFNQIEKRLSEIKTLNPNNYPNIPLSKIQNATKYYYVIVSEETIMNNYRIYNNYLSKINSIHSKVPPLYLNVTEFEYFLMSLLKRKKPINKVIDYYHENYYNCNFSDFIMKERKSFKFDRLDVIENKNISHYIKKVLNKSENE